MKMIPKQRARRIAILTRLWPRQMPVRTIIAVLDRDGHHWNDEACRRAMQAVGIVRPKPLAPPAWAANEPTPWEIRAASRQFGDAIRSVPAGGGQAREREEPGPWRSIMSRPDPRVAMAGEAARIGRMGRVWP